jgi:glycerol dehydrogenase
MTQVLIAPGRYVQGAGAIHEIGQHASLLGKSALVTGSRTGLAQTREAILRSLESAGITGVVEAFNGESSWEEIDRLATEAKRAQCDLVIGVGGGKALDTAKAVAFKAGARAAMVPTIASTDAPCSAISIIYTPEHTFQQVLTLPRNPDLVLVDTAVCARAPVRFLVAGMGDALATWFEADACQRSGSRSITLTAMALARLCYNTLLDYGLQAREAASKGAVTPAVEKIVEANTLLSGLGFESAGLAAAHSVYDGFTILHHRHHMYHGEVVAFGTLVQLVIEGRPESDVLEVVDFCASVGLPHTLAQMNLADIQEEELIAVARKATAEGEYVHNMAVKVTPGMMRDAIVAADAIGQAFQR